MSSTIVHSGKTKQDNPCLRGGFFYEDVEDLKMVMPPESAKKGPSKLAVKTGETMEIIAENSRMNENGELIKEDGKIDTANFGKKAYKQLIAKRNKEQNHIVVDSKNATKVKASARKTTTKKATSKVNKEEVR